MRAVIRRLGTPGGRLSTLVCHAPAIAHCAIPFGPVKIARRVVPGFGLSVTQPGGDVTVLGSQTRLPTAQAGQLVGARVFAVFGGLGAIFGRHPAVVDGLGAVVGSAGATRGGLVTFVCRLLTVGRRAIACGSVKIARRVIARFGLAVAQPGRDVTVLGSQTGHSPAHSSQLVGPGVFAVLGGLGAIFGRHLAVVDSLGTVIGGFSVPGGRSGAFACRPSTFAHRPIPFGSVKIAGRVVARLSLSVALLGLPVTHVRREIAVATLYVTLARRRQGVIALIGPAAVLIGERDAACLSFGHMSAGARGAHRVLQRRSIAITNAAIFRHTLTTIFPCAWPDPMYRKASATSLSG